MDENETDTQGPEPVAWMYTRIGHKGGFVEMPLVQTNRANMNPRYWTETPLSPTSLVTDLLDALRECADDLEAEIEARRGAVLDRTMERDLETVRRARAAIAKAEGRS